MTKCNLKIATWTLGGKAKFYLYRDFIYSNRESFTELSIHHRINNKAAIDRQIAEAAQ